MGHTLLQKIISPITITIDSSIRDNTREVINIYNRALRNTIINTTLLRRIPIQNQQKPSIAEKWRKKAKNRTLNSIRLAFVKNTTMSNPAKRLKYINVTTWITPDLPIVVTILWNTTAIGLQLISIKHYTWVNFCQEHSRIEFEIKFHSQVFPLITLYRISLVNVTKWPRLVTLTEKILNGKLQFFYAVFVICKASLHDSLQGLTTTKQVEYFE